MCLYFIFLSLSLEGDKIGRKSAMFLGMTLVVPAVILGGWASNYWLYVFLRLVSCTVIVFCWIASHNFIVYNPKICTKTTDSSNFPLPLQIEYFSKSHRRHAVALNNLIAHITNFTLPALVYFNRDWTSMHVAGGLVAALAFPTYFFFPESFRWLVSNGRWREAEVIFQVWVTSNLGSIVVTARRMIPICFGHKSVFDFRHLGRILIRQ